jgi:uncharacterized coiled-coil DUF342 family protein
MRRTAGLVAGLLLVGGLAGCGQDGAETTDEQFCSDVADLESEVDEFNSMAESGADLDALNVQALAIVAAAKALSADTQRLDDEEAKDSLNDAQLELQASIDAVEAESDSLAEAEAGITAAVDEYAATVDEVSAQLGCASTE